MTNPSVFISYARKDDEEFVERLRNDLIGRHINVWWDQVSMQSRGRTFLQELRDAIESVDRVIAVIGPHAMSSDYVQAEWDHARIFAKAIVPVLRQGEWDQVPDLNRYDGPDLRADRDYDDGLAKLLVHLRTRVPPLGRLLTEVPTLPARFQVRSEILSQLQQLVLADINRPTVVTSPRQTTVLHGMGGSGKSVVAAAFCRSIDVRTAMSDGIIWIPIGREPEPLQPYLLLLRALGDDPPTSLTDTEISVRLGNSLTGKKCLIVLDDVWDVIMMSPVLNALRPQNRLLATSRDQGLIPGGQKLVVDMLSKDQSLRLLADWSGEAVDSLPLSAEDVVDKCGRLPFALALCGATRLEDGLSWESMAEGLRSADLTFLEQRFPNYERYATILRSLKVSVDQLESADADRYRLLIAFGEDTEIPEAAIVNFWVHTDGLSLPRAEILLGQLARKALITATGRAPNRLITIHDLLHDYLRSTTDDPRAPHDALLDAYRAQCTDGTWWTGPNDGYFFQHVTRNFRMAAHTAELKELLLRIEWLEAKLAATDAPTFPGDYAPGLDKAVDAVRDVLLLSTGVLDRDAAQLPYQLLGRVDPDDNHDLDELLAAARAKITAKGGFELLTPSLRLAGGALVHLLRDRSTSRRVLDGVWLLDGDEEAVVAASDMLQPWHSALCRWNVKEGRLVTTLELGMEITAAAASRTGKALLGLRTRRRDAFDFPSFFSDEPAEPEDFLVRLVHLGDDNTTVDIGSHDFNINAVAITPDGGAGVTASADGVVRLWKLLGAPTFVEIASALRGISATTVSTNGESVAVATRTELHVWRDARVTGNKWPVSQPAEITALAFTTNGTQLLSGARDGTIKLWDVATGDEIRIFPGHLDQIRDLCVGRTERTFASAAGGGAVYSIDNSARVWSLEEGSHQALWGHGHTVTGVALSDTDEIAVSASFDGAVGVWDLTRAPREEPFRHRDDVNLLVSAGRSGHVISGANDGRLIQWNPQTGAAEKSELTGHLPVVEAVVIPERGLLVTASGSYNRSEPYRVELRNLDTLELERCLSETESAIRTLTVTPGGRFVAAGGNAGAISLWDLDTGQHHLLKGHEAWVYEIQPLPGGRRLVSAAGDGTLRLWDAHECVQEQVLQGTHHDINGVAILHDGRTALSRSSSGLMQVWDLETQSVIRLLKGHDSVVNGISVRENRAMSNSGDGHVIVWDTTSWEPVLSKTLSSGVITSTLAIDNHHFLTTAWDGRTGLWRVSDGHCLTTFVADAALEAGILVENILVVGDRAGGVHFLRLPQLPGQSSEK